MGKTNKRFMFATWTIFCVSVVSIIQNMPSETYKLMVLAIVGGYLGFQSWTDKRGKDNGNS